MFNDEKMIEKRALLMIIDAFEQELNFYDGLDNVDWSNEKNDGFKEGIKYSKEFVQRIVSQIYE